MNQEFKELIFWRKIVYVLENQEWENQIGVELLKMATHFRTRQMDIQKNLRQVN